MDMHYLCLTSQVVKILIVKRLLRNASWVNLYQITRRHIYVYGINQIRNGNRNNLLTRFDSIIRLLLKFLMNNFHISLHNFNVLIHFILCNKSIRMIQ